MAAAFAAAAHASSRRCSASAPLAAAMRRLCRLRAAAARPTASFGLHHALPDRHRAGQRGHAEQAALLKPGMTRPQVRDILGSPLLTDVFHADRWDYVFTLRRQGAEPQRRSVVVFFEGDALKRVEADELPSEREFVASIDAASRDGKVPQLELTEDELKALPAAARAASRRRPSPVGPAAQLPAAGSALKRGRRTLPTIAVAGASAAWAACWSRPCSAAATARWPARSTSPAARRSARTPAPSSAAHSGVPITADLRARPGGRRRADRLHPPRRHAGAPGGSAASSACNAVIGTTGFSAGAEGRDRRAAQAHRHRDGAQHERGRQRHAASCWRWRRARWRTGYDIEIIEAHHRHKVDAPSGTALRDGRGASPRRWAAT